MGNQYSSEVLELRDRVIKGNSKLILAWDQICKIDHNSQRWRDEIDKWSKANEYLSSLCNQLKALSYHDCLYITDGKKTKKCGDVGAIGCRVCPSIREYWIEEMNFKP